MRPVTCDQFIEDVPQLWAGAPMEVISRAPLHINGVTCMSMGRELATGGADGRVNLIDPHTGLLRHSIAPPLRFNSKVNFMIRSPTDERGSVGISTDPPNIVTALAWSPSLKRLAGALGGHIFVIGTDSGTILKRRFKHLIGQTWALSWYGGEKFIATASHGKAFDIREGSTEEGRTVVEAETFITYPFSMAINPHFPGEAIVGGVDGWEIRRGNLQKVAAYSPSYVTALAVMWSLDGEEAFIGNSHGGLSRFRSGAVDRRGDRPDVLFTVSGDSFIRTRTAVLCMARAPGRRICALGDSHGHICLFHEGLGPLALLNGHVGAVQAMAFRDDGEVLFSGGKDGTVRMWRVRDLIDRRMRDIRQDIFWEEPEPIPQGERHLDL